MEIKDISVEQITANDSDYLVLQNPTTGIAYKITRANFLAGLSSGSTLSTGFLLDGIPDVISARSTRQLSSTYKGFALQAMLSDNSVKDISFASRTLDTATLKTFGGSANVYVRNFCDQVGNFTTTSTSPPKIIDAGILQTAGSKPTVSYSGNFLAIPISTGYPITIIAAVKISGATNGAFIKYGDTNNGIGIGCGNGTFDSSGINLTALNEAIAWISSNNPLSTSQMSIVEINSVGTSTSIYLNGTLITTGGGSNIPSGNYIIGGYGSRMPNCQITEDIIFNQIITAGTRAKIVSNMMTYYGIT